MSQSLLLKTYSPLGFCDAPHCPQSLSLNRYSSESIFLLSSTPEYPIGTLNSVVPKQEFISSPHSLKPVPCLVFPILANSIPQSAGDLGNLGIIAPFSSPSSAPTPPPNQCPNPVSHNAEHLEYLITSPAHASSFFTGTKAVAASSLLPLPKAQPLNTSERSSF